MFKLKGRFILRCPLVLFFILCLFQWQPSFPQLENIHPEIINEAQGLSSRIINCFLQDHTGYMWIGTGEGLNRYDGYSFRVFRKTWNDSTSLLDNDISTMKEDKDGMIWIGYVKGGISCFNPETQKCIHYTHDETVKGSIPPGGITCLFFDKENTMWLGIFQHSLTRFNRKDQTFFNYRTLPDIDPGYTPESRKNYNSVNAILQTGDGMYWLITNNGLYSFDKEKDVFTPKRSKPIVAYKWRDDGFGPHVLNGDTALWLGSWGGGISYFNIKTGKWKNFKFDPLFPESGTHNIIFGLQRKNNDELWITTAEQFGVFNTREEKFYLKKKAADNSREKNMYWLLYADRNDNLWFALTKGVGLIRANAEVFSFTKFKVTKSFNGDFYGVQPIYKDTVNHLLFVGTSWADGLHVIDEKTGSEQILPFSTAINEKNIPKEEDAYISSDIKKDHKGRIWVSTRDFIYQYDLVSRKLITVPQPPVDTSFKRSPFYNELLEDSGHNIWLSTLRYGVFKLNPETFSYTHFDHSDNDSSSLHARSINTMAEDKFKRIWFGNAQKGVSCYDQLTGKFKAYRHNDKDAYSIAGDAVTSMKKDADGNIWMSTYGGLSKMEMDASGNVKFINYTSKEGLPSEMIGDLVFDKNGNIWIASFAGVSILNPVSKHIKTYTFKDGLTEGYGNFMFYKADDGEFFIETGGGYFRFYPWLLKRSDSSLPLVINSFKIFDKEKPLEKDANINLSYKENFFSFDFASINFCDPENIHYAYKLEGFDKDWVYCGNRRYASYTNLNGGNYTFKVKASDRDGAWNKAEISIPINIEPPYWKKGWFIFLTIVLITLLIYSLYMYRIQHIRRTETLKTEFNKKIADVEMRALRAQMNPHFVFNCLNSINRYIVKSDTKTASLYLTKFAKLIRLILDNSESPNVPLSNELEALKLYVEMESIRFENKFNYEIKTIGDLNVDNVSVPPLIVQPYVENAIWHGLLSKEMAGKLLIEVSQYNGTLQVIVEDNGVGRAKAKELKSKSATTRKSLGMKLTEDRLAILNEHTDEKSSVQILDLKDENGFDCGTKVIIRISLSEN